jgi:hypothetical protein
MGSSQSNKIEMNRFVRRSYMIFPVNVHRFVEKAYLRGADCIVPSSVRGAGTSLCGSTAPSNKPSRT